MQTQELAALEDLELVELEPLGMPNVENFSSWRLLRHFGHSMRFALERTTAWKAQDGGLNGVPAPFSQNNFRLFR